jgi:hypothetical protein
MAICTIEKLAISFLKSTTPAIAQPANKMLKSRRAERGSESERRIERKARAAQAENFSAKAARTTEPGQEASTWASGSHAEAGYAGVFIKTIPEPKAEIKKVGMIESLVV